MPPLHFRSQFGGVGEGIFGDKKDVRKQAAELICARGIPRGAAGTEQPGVLEDHAEAQFLRITDKDLTGLNMRADAFDGVVAAVNDGGIRLGQPAAAQFTIDLHPSSQFRAGAKRRNSVNSAAPLLSRGWRSETLPGAEEEARE